MDWRKPSSLKSRAAILVPILISLSGWPVRCRSVLATRDSPVPAGEVMAFGPP